MVWDLFSYLQEKINIHPDFTRRGIPRVSVVLAEVVVILNSNYVPHPNIFDKMFVLGMVFLAIKNLLHDVEWIWSPTKWIHILVGIHDVTFENPTENSIKEAGHTHTHTHTHTCA